MIANKNNTENRRALDQSVTLLCIDDEADNLKLLAAIFEKEYQIIACKNAEQGYLKAQQHNPDIILLDVVMPSMSGFELIQKLKANSELRHIPVIFITGLQSPADEEQGLTLGACDYIQKPFNNSIVKVRVNTHLKIVRQRQLLERYANIDALTEIPNRRKWDDDVQQVWYQAAEDKSSLVIGIIDIDYFKQFNDHYGHLAGDTILKKVAYTLKHSLLPFSGKVYRCGGEEFYFYIPYHQNLDIQSALGDCLDSISDLKIPHAEAICSPYLSISIGAIKIIPSAKLTLQAVIKSADDLLYQVKHKTRNAVQYQEVNNE